MGRFAAHKRPPGRFHGFGMRVTGGGFRVALGVLRCDLLAGHAPPRQARARASKPSPVFDAGPIRALHIGAGDEARLHRKGRRAGDEPEAVRDYRA